LTNPTEPSGLAGQRYERQGILGSGGQGVVYRAFDRWTGRAVAIKVLGSAAAREPHMVERLSREQQALSALKGTAAVEVLDIYRGNDGELCLVMELLKGTNLDEHLQVIEAMNQRIELPRVAEIFDPIVNTLETAHKAGIVHRDLKPANVFLLEDGGVRLLDFGMARMKRSAPLTAEGTVMGSPSFMAPEAWKGQSAAVDHRADVYSLGVIVFRVLAGDLPFSGITLYEKMLGSTKAVRPSLFAKRPDLPRDADEWVALALAINRDERFQNVRALWTAFLATFDVAPPGKERPSFWAKATGKVKELAGIPNAPSSGDTPISSDPKLADAEPSFITAALRRSMSHVPEPPPLFEPPPTRSTNERTLEILEKPSASGAPTAPAPDVAPVEKPAEKTLELGSEELISVEKTLELDSEELVSVEETLPDAALVSVEDTLPGAALVQSDAAKSPVSNEKRPVDSKRRRRNKKKRERRKRR
jgi:serine/threonine-protein kinase